METTITSHEDLIALIKGGHIFQFCVAFALNKGYVNVMKEKKACSFSVGDYEVGLDYEKMCFMFNHKKYLARIIHAYPQEVVFIGDSEEEVINELLTEFEKEDI